MAEYSRGRAPARGRRRQPTAKKFQARASGRRTTEFQTNYGTVAINWSGVMRFGIPLLDPAGANNITRVGGLKLTYRMTANTTSGSNANAICVGLYKTTSGEVPVAAAAFTSSERIRKVFGKETWIDIATHSPVLAQHVVKGMLTVSATEQLWLVYQAARVIGSAAGQLAVWWEWSQRETSIDG